MTSREPNSTERIVLSSLNSNAIRWRPSNLEDREVQDP